MSKQGTANTQRLLSSRNRSGLSWLDAARLIAALALGALLFALSYQFPVTHVVDIGGYDSAYVQGFYDPERDAPGQAHPELAGSDGSARWSQGRSYLLFPQAGLPARVTLRLRGWRPAGPAPQVSVLLNDAVLLGTFRASADWQEYSFPIAAGLLKPNDVVIAIHSDTATLGSGDPRTVGVLLDRVSYQAGPAPLLPYPAQLLYGALAAGLLYVLILPAHGSPDASRLPALWAWGLAVLLVCLAFALLYRAQPPYPYPLLRLLPTIDGVLGALLALRYGPALARRAPWLLDLLALGGAAVWLVAVIASAQSHVTLSIPGVEKDFHVFALRSAHLLGSFQPSGVYPAEVDGVLRADGFYNLGYPFLLWLIRPLVSDSPFLAARLLAAMSAALLLVAGWWLARQLLGRAPALLALLVLALSPLVVQYALYFGTDMPFAALCALALALLARACAEPQNRRTVDTEHPTPNTQHPTPKRFWVLAGLVSGLAFLMRHPGLLLLPLGWLAIWRGAQGKTQRTHYVMFFTLAFVGAILPQLAVNLRDTGQPLYSQQAKNIWQGVFGDGDWGRWAAASNSISLGQVLAQDPTRFLANWWANLRGFFGSGGEDTREFGQAVQLRMLGFPANWLAIAGLLGWLVLGLRGRRFMAERRQLRIHPFTAILLAWILVFVATVSIGLAPQPRFFLALAPIYALAAAWLVQWAMRRATIQQPLFMLRAPLLTAIVLAALLWGGFAIGTSYVLRSQPSADEPGQAADEVAIVQLVQATLPPGAQLLVRVDPRIAIGKYSAIAHLATPAPATDAVAAIRASGAQYLLWDASLGSPPAVGARVGAAGRFALYRIDS